VPTPSEGLSKLESIENAVAISPPSTRSASARLVDPTRPRPISATTGAVPKLSGDTPLPMLGTDGGEVDEAVGPLGGRDGAMIGSSGVMGVVGGERAGGGNRGWMIGSSGVGGGAEPPGAGSGPITGPSGVGGGGESLGGRSGAMIGSSGVGAGGEPPGGGKNGWIIGSSGVGGGGEPLGGRSGAMSGSRGVGGVVGEEPPGSKGWMSESSGVDGGDGGEPPVGNSAVTSCVVTLTWSVTCDSGDRLSRPAEGVGSGD
jgi:hypothetical protein